MNATFINSKKVVKRGGGNIFTFLMTRETRPEADSCLCSIQLHISLFASGRVFRVGAKNEMGPDRLGLRGLKRARVGGADPARSLDEGEARGRPTRPPRQPFDPNRNPTDEKLPNTPRTQHVAKPDPSPNPHAHGLIFPKLESPSFLNPKI